MTLLGYYVGARLDVVARLRWTNVDLKRNLICYETNKVRRGKKPTIIQCPIHPELREHLESLHLAKNGEDHLLPVLAKRRKSGKTGLSETFQELLVAAGVEVPRGREKTGKGRQFRMLGFPSLRHSFNQLFAHGDASAMTRPDDYPNELVFENNGRALSFRMTIDDFSHALLNHRLGRKL